MVSSMWKGLLRDCEIFVFFLTFGLIILQWRETGEENSEGEQGEEAGEEHVGLVDVAGLVDSVDIVDVIYTGCPILLGPLCFCYFLGF